jgi:hypothetical protein
MPRVKAAQVGKQGPAKRRLAEQFAVGEIITDMSKKEWKLGVPIGQGGFGCIYLGKFVTTSIAISPETYVLSYQNDFLFELFEDVPNNLL